MNAKQVIKQIHIIIYFIDAIIVKLIFVSNVKISIKTKIHLIILLIMMIKIIYMRYLMKNIHHIVKHVKKIFVYFAKSNIKNMN